MDELCVSAQALASGAGRRQFERMTLTASPMTWTRRFSFLGLVLLPQEFLKRRFSGRRHIRGYELVNRPRLQKLYVRDAR